MTSRLPLEEKPSELLLRLSVTPNARRNAIETIESDPNGRPVLKIRVTANPEKGKANAAVLKLLAKFLGIPKSSISLVAGTKSRDKTIAIKELEYAPQISERLSTVPVKTN